MLAYLFLLLAVGVRFLPHTFGLTPLTAALLFFGAKRPRREVLYALPLLALADVGLNYFVYHYALSLDLLVTWAWYAGMMLASNAILRQNARPLRLTAASLSGSVSFFVISNFAVWLVWQMYPMTLAGLAACYAAGVPFFRYAMLGDLAFTLVIFTLAHFVEQMSARKVEVAA